MRGLNLFWRGILIVLIPLVCQVVLLVVLFDNLNKLQSQVIAYSQSKNMIGEVYEFTAKLVRAVGALRMGADEQGMIEMDTGSKDIESALKQFRSLVDFAKDDPARRAKLEEFVPAFEDIYKLFLWIRREHMLGEEHWKQVNEGFPQMFADKGNRLHSAMNAFVDAEQKNFPYKSEKLESEWKTVKTLPYLAIACSTILAVLLLLFYAITIKRPIAQISENCRRMSEGSAQLLPPVRSGDELGDLDRLVHRLNLSLNEALDKERAMIDNARDMICSLNAQGIFLRTNSYCAELLGTTPQEIVGKSLLDICSSEDQVLADDELHSACSTDDMRTFDLKLKRRSETVDTRWSCIWSERDSELFAVVHDITEEKNVERLKQDFVDMISHDLRSPLTSMLGSLTMLSAGARGPLPAAADDEVNSAIKSVERLIEFVNDLLDFQKLKAARMELDRAAVQLGEVVEEAIDLVRASADAKSVTIVTVGAPITVFGDQKKLLQVTMNLLSNAIRFAPSDSQVKVELLDGRDYGELQVVDQGPGVPAAFQEKIFDAFEQVPSDVKSKEGTGLGLAICKLIVEAHGGTIGVRGIFAGDVRKETGQKERKAKTGSIFWFRIPKHAEVRAAVKVADVVLETEKGLDGEDSNS